MAAVEKLLVSNTAPKPDAARAAPKVPFAPFLVAQMEARLSDLGAPRDNETPPAKTERTDDRPRNNQATGDGSRDHDRTTDRLRLDAREASARRRADDREPTRIAEFDDRGETTKPNETSGATGARSEKSEDAVASPDNAGKDAAETPSERSESADQTVETNQTAKNSGESQTASNETAPPANEEAAPSTGPNSDQGVRQDIHLAAPQDSSQDVRQDVNQSTHRDTGQEGDTAATASPDLSDTTIASGAVVPAAPGQSDTASMTPPETTAGAVPLVTPILPEPAPGTAAAAIGGATIAAANGPALPANAHPLDTAAAAPTGGAAQNTAAQSTEAGGKTQHARLAAGLTPSNDDAPPRTGTDIPQVVRDVQSIIARPANASGGNLVQAQQQVESIGSQPPPPSSQPASAAPAPQNVAPNPTSNVAPNPTSNAASNAAPNTPLHVGADAGQNSGQTAGNANGQHSGGQQSGGQQSGNQQSGGQQPGSQGGNNGAGSSGGQPIGTPMDIAGGATAQQTARNFQTTLARGLGAGNAASPTSAAGDLAPSGRLDAASAPIGSTQSAQAADQAARAAQANAPPRPHPSAATEQVSARLTKAIETGDSTLRIQLRPHELGRVEVKLDIGADGHTKALVLAERPETLELLQRDSRVLERALQDAGLKADQSSLSFDLQGRQGEDQTQQAQQGSDGGGSSDDPGAASDNNIDEHPIPATAIGLAPDGSVNFLA